MYVFIKKNKKLKKIILVVTLFLALGNAQAQQAFKWPGGKKAAIILTYDDALQSQLNIVAPQLLKYKLTGTFFLDGKVSKPDMERWRHLSKAGNELANHSLYHPCSVKAYKAAHYSEDYTVAGTIKEIGMMNAILDSINGHNTRTYAYPCGMYVANGVDYTDSLIASGIVKYARVGGDNRTAIVSKFNSLDFFKVPSWGVAKGTEGAALIAAVKETLKANGMLVYMFHGVGGDYLDVSAEAHRELLQFLAENKNDVWVGTFQEVLDYVKKYRK
jgi:peptidoglycan/xylan/chitin deacetylase (PgdA/CDA1 family)